MAFILSADDKNFPFVDLYTVLHRAVPAPTSP